MTHGVDEVPADCPHCGAAITVLVDPGSGTHQTYVEDCEVCCRPWTVTVVYPRPGEPPVLTLEPA